MLIFSFRPVQCFLAALLALPILAGNAAERRAGTASPRKPACCASARISWRW